MTTWDEYLLPKQEVVCLITTKMSVRENNAQHSATTVPIVCSLVLCVPCVIV
jgi:hypothetical protein